MVGIVSGNNQTHERNETFKLGIRSPIEPPDSKLSSRQNCTEYILIGADRQVIFRFYGADVSGSLLGCVNTKACQNISTANHNFLIRQICNLLYVLLLSSLLWP
jgi:hypothetical protein